VARKNVLPALRDLYDEIWVYGLPQICDPLEGIDCRIGAHKITYTGYLRASCRHGRRAAAPAGDHRRALHPGDAGGGGDGEA
jgi:predicted glycosyltransferase